MIQSKLGEVKLTQPNYELCKLLNCSSEEVDISVEATLSADLSSILMALAHRYGAEKALSMWTHSAQIVIDELKGE